MRKIILSLFFFVVIAVTVQAQEVFLSVSGKNANPKITGDELHQYDYWIKPETQASNAMLQIFDASLGGIADFIIDKPETQTVFELYPFDALYTLKGNSVTAVTPRIRPVSSITVTNEVQYINRWIPFFPLDASKNNGWILRVRAVNGDDVNSFQLLASDSGSAVTERRDWKIIAVDLSVCLFRISLTSEAQFRPYLPEKDTLINFKPLGEEKSLIGIRDLYGEYFPLPMKKNNYLPVLENGMANAWCVAIQGSPDGINNLVLRGTSSPVLWEYKPVIVRQPQKPELLVRQVPGSDCSSVKFILNVQSRKLLFGNQPKWSFGKTILEHDSAAINFEKPGNYSVSLFFPTRGAFFPSYWVEKIPVRINAPPKAVITADKYLAAPGEIVSLSAQQSFDPERAPLKYSWFVNGEFRSDESSLTLSSLLPTTYSVRLVVNDEAVNSSCTEDEATVKIRINAQPYADIHFRKIFGRATPVQFSVKDIVDNDGDTLYYTWNGSGIIGPKKGTEITVRQENAGAYTLSVTASDNTKTSNESYTTSVSYRVNAEPKPEFSLPRQAAPGDTVEVISKTTDEDNSSLSYMWNTSNGHSLTGERAKISFDSPGDYSVTLTADDGEGVENSVQSITKTIHINAPPVPVITAESRSTAAQQKFSAEKTTDADNESLVYLWDFGDGTTAIGKSQIHVYQKSGTYIITLTVDDRQHQINSVQVALHKLVINKYPVAEFSLPKMWEPETPIAVNGGKSYDEDGKISEYTWLINGKAVGSGVEDSLIFSEPGDYAVALRVKDNSGFDDAVAIQSIPIHINYPPAVQWKMIPEVAEPNVPVMFDASSSSDVETKILKKVYWKFSDGTNAEGIKVQKTFAKAGIITVQVSVDDESGFSNSVQRAEGSVLVNSSPIIVTKTLIRTNSRRILLDASQSYDIDKQAINFEWLLPDGSKVNKAVFTWDAPAGGVHFISLTADDGQGKKNSKTRETIKILVNRPPIAVVDSLIYSCTGQTILFNGSLSSDPDGDAISTKWDFGDGKTSTETNPAHSYSSPGYYTVTLLLDDGFADHPTTATIPVIVEGSPFAVQTFSDTTVCVNIPVNFNGTLSVDPNGPIGSFSWDFGDGISSFGEKVSHAYTKPGTYYAVLTIIGSGSGRCSKVSQAVSTVKVIEGPSAALEMPEQVSIGELFTVNPSASKPNGEVSLVRWKFGSDTTITSASLQPVQYQFKKSGIYDVELFIQIQTTTNCNAASVIKKIHVNEPPVLVWNIPTDVPLGDPLVLNATKSYDPDGIIAQFEWNIDGRKAGTTPIVSAANLSAGTHTITLKISDNSKTSSRSVSKEMTVRVNSKPNPTFMLPEPIYENEPVPLQPYKLVDSDGDSLRFTWRVNNEIISSGSVAMNAGKNVITLTADDGRNLKNSIDSVQREVFVLAPPPLSVRHAENYLVNAELNASSIFNAGAVQFLADGKLSPSWKPRSAGKQDIHIAWTPKGTALEQAPFSITAWDSLRFAEKLEPQPLTWNPSNPKIILSAPAVNRPETMRVQYEWRKGKTQIGIGKVIEAPLNAGRNVFTVRAIDQDIIGGNAVETEFIVLCE